MTKAQVERFQQICEEEFGGRLSHEEAIDNSVKLVEMVRLIYKPIDKADYEKAINQ